MKKPVFDDTLSKVKVRYSLSDKKRIKGKGNIFSNPEFENDQTFDFRLKDNSPARMAGDKNQNLGADIFVINHQVPKIVINEINFSPNDDNGPVVWIEMYNNSKVDVDLTGWTFKNENHYTYAFPQKLILKKDEYLVLTNDITRFTRLFPNVRNVRRNLNLQLVTKGEAILLYNAQMNLVDFVDYKNMTKWPSYPDKSGISIRLKTPSSNNNKEDNWIFGPYKSGTPGK